MALPLPSFALPLSLRALSLSHSCSRSASVLLPLFRLLLPIDTFATKVVHLLRSLTHTHTHAYTHTIRLELVSICYFYCLCLLASSVGPHWGYVATNAIKIVRKSAKSQNTNGRARGGKETRQCCTDWVANLEKMSEQQFDCWQMFQKSGAAASVR